MKHQRVLKNLFAHFLKPLLLMPLLLASNNSYGGEKYPDIAERYLGQKPPKMTPQAFAPGKVFTDDYLESEVLFLPDMTELSFTRSGGKYQKPALYVMQYKDKQWHKKMIAPADAKQYQTRFSPTVAEMKQHEVFKDIPIIGLAKSASDTYYFYELDFNDGSGHMSYSRLVNGQYEKPIKMTSAVNRGKYIAHPYIAPDESYLMWDAEKEGESTPDIYISFRQKDGSWGVAMSMGDKINTPLYEQRPKVTPDGKYLFFWRGDVKKRDDGSTYVEGGPHWVDAKVIEVLRAQQ